MDGCDALLCQTCTAPPPRFAPLRCRARPQERKSEKERNVRKRESLGKGRCLELRYLQRDYRRRTKLVSELRDRADPTMGEIDASFMRILSAS